MKPRRRVLVIDDTPEDRAIIRRFLLSDRETDFSIDEASSGEEGLEFCQRGGHDVILLDMQLPGLDGLGVLRTLRSSGFSAPVVVLTLNLARNLANQALELGAVDFLVKDELTPTVLTRAISNATIRVALQRRLEENASRSALLVTLSTALSSADTPEKVIQILLDGGIRAASATSGFVALLAEDRKHLSVAAFSGQPPNDKPSWKQLELEAELPAAEAARARALITCSTLAERNKRYPALLQSAQSEKALAVLPLVAGDGVLGVLFLSFTEEREFSAADVAFLHLLGGVCEQALRRARTQAGEREAKDQLRIAAERYRALVEAGTPIIWSTDERGQIVSTTVAWAALTGQTGEEATGRGWFEAVHPEDQERALRLWAEALSTSRIYSAELRVRDQRGGWRRHEVRAVPVRELDGRVREWVGANVDITERRRLEQEQTELRDQAERRAAELHAVLESIPDGVFMGDMDRVHYANQAAVDMLGLDISQPLNFRVQELRLGYEARDPATGETLPREKSGYVRALREGVKSVMELRVRHQQDGRELILRAASAPVIVQGQIVAAVTVNADITESKRAHELLKTTAAFEKHLIGIVSHDLKTPLQTILMQAQMMQRESLSEGLRTGLGRVERAARRSNQLISDLLDFAKGRSGGGFSIVRRKGDLGEVVLQAVEALRLSNPARDIVLRVHGDLSGAWDRERLDQMITNLVANALQHGDASAPVIVDVKEQQNQFVLLEISNRGEPIRLDVMPHLFEPFGAGSGKRNNRNAGLGLYIVDQIVRAHNGRIEVSSTVAEGTRFIVRLPREASDRPLAAR